VVVVWLPLLLAGIGMASLAFFMDRSAVGAFVALLLTTLVG
jgi:hypothetical protein